MQFNWKCAQRLMMGSAVLFLISCTENNGDPDPVKPYDSGVFVINEGNFNENNGSISLIDRTSGNVTYDLFYEVNKRSLQGGVADYIEADGKGIVLVDNATPGKDVVELVEAGTFRSVGVIPSSEVENPRAAVRAAAGKVYVSCWDTFNEDYSYKPGFVTVIDLVSGKAVKKITVEKGAEKLLLAGEEVVVGSVGNSTTISFIDTRTDAVARTVEIGANPDPIGLDANGKLWIYAGNALIRFNVASKTVEARFSITSPVSGKTASNFSMSKDRQSVFYVYSFYDEADGYKQKGETYVFNVNSTTVSAEKPLINKLFTGLGADPVTGILYAGFTPSYKQAGYVFRYQPDGRLVDSLKAEIGPSGFFFK